MSGSNASVGTSSATKYGRFERMIAAEVKRRRAEGEPLPSGNHPEVKLTFPGFPTAPSDED